MTVATLLVRLYPPAIRQRWGADLEHDVDSAGPTSWLDTALGAARLWLHPSDWPAAASEQTTRVLVTALAVVTAISAMLLRAVGSVAPTARLDHVMPSVWLAPVLIGLALASPLPLLRRYTLGRLTGTAARALVAPMLALAALVLLAHSGLIDDHPAGVSHLVLVGYYWATLCFAGVRLCLLVARVGRFLVMPSLRRLQLALLFVGAGLALVSVQVLSTSVRLAPHVGTVVASCALATIAAAVFAAGRDLRHALR